MITHHEVSVTYTTHIGTIPHYIYEACMMLCLSQKKISAIKLVRAYVQETFPEYIHTVNDGEGLFNKHLFGLKEASAWVEREWEACTYNKSKASV